MLDDSEIEILSENEINKFINAISCMSYQRKEFYKKIIGIRYEILKEVYNNL